MLCDADALGRLVFFAPNWQSSLLRITRMLLVDTEKALPKIYTGGTPAKKSD
jgi:hypothetical protein